MTLGIDPEDRIPVASPKGVSGWQRNFGAFVRVGVVLVVIGAVGASSWPYVKEHFLTPTAPSGPLPVIGPGDQPIKEAPKQPGGMVVPDQDKIILNGAAAQPKIEQILPAPPAPLPSPTPPPAAAQTTVAPTPAPAGSPPVATATPVPPSSAPPASAATSPTAATAPSRTIEVPSPQTAAAAPAAHPASVTAASPPRPAPTAMVSHETVPPQLVGHGWFVQLGAVRSTAAAQAEWTRLKRAQPDLLASLAANAVRVDRGDAVLYRIEAGPLADAGIASHLCRSLQQRHVACIVLRP
jgi:SPOR domain